MTRAAGTTRIKKWGAGFAGVLLALLAWQILTTTKVLDPVAVPKATTALSTLWTSLGTSHLWAGVGQTMQGTAIGFGLGVVLGVGVGVLIGLSDVAFRSTFLTVEFLKTIPVIAVLPLVVLLYGTTLHMKVVLVTFGVFFPMVIQTSYGVRSVDPVVADTARAFGLGPINRFFSVTLPSAAPFIATGMRLSAAAALLLDVLAEIVAGGSGLGLQILQGQAGGDIAYTYALIVLVGIIGVIVVLTITAIERRVMHWHELYRGGVAGT
jgi:ABC-type nitrate/sulfonate/bicarbonate transport system permease component